MKQILDAEYKKINLRTVVMSLNYSKDKHKYSLLELLQKYEKMFEQTLGKYTGSNCTIELSEDAKPYHAKSFPIPKIHGPTLKKEVKRLIKIGVLKKIHHSQWSVPTFIIPKINGKVRFISDSRELNKTIKSKPVPIPKHSRFIT